MLVSGSFLSDTIKPKDAIEVFDKTGVDFIHVDIMDGKFVENKSYTISDVMKYSTYTKKPLDVHLMVKNPDKYIDDLSMLNTKYITFHLEAVKNPMSVIEHIKNNGVSVGVCIKPSTSVSDVFPILPYLDLVLILSVEPGKSGQQFMDSVLYKLDVLRREINEKKLKTIISIDGGINDISFPKVKDRVDMVVSSSYLLSGDTCNKVKSFKIN